MTERLKRVVSEIELLPSDQQDAIADLLERELEEMEWDALVSSPRSQRFLAQLVAEARAEDAAGLTQELDDDW